MRRLILIVAILFGLWMLVMLLRAANTAQPEVVEDEPPADEPVAEEPVTEPEPEPVPEPAAEPSFAAEEEATAVMPSVHEVPVDPEAAPEVVSAPFANEQGDELQAEVTRLRAEIIERVERRPLFVMAEERNVPYFRLFFMTKPELLDAIMEAEGIPPEDVLPSSETVARVRALADEAYRRHDEITAEEAAQQSAS